MEILLDIERIAPCIRRELTGKGDNDTYNGKGR